MDKILTQLTERMAKTFGDRLVSVILYGSAAGKDYHGKFSDLNVLCVLKEITPRELADSEPIFRWFRDQGNPPPLLLSEEEIATSTDCFPIEFDDMQEQSRVLHGKNVVEGLVIDKVFYRAQVEYQLRSKLLRLRQKSAAALSGKDTLRSLMADSVSTFCILIRHALKLAGVTAEATKRGVVQQAAAQFPFNPAPFLGLLDLREGRVKPRDVDPVPLLESYLKQIQVIVDAVDKMER